MSQVARGLCWPWTNYSSSLNLSSIICKMWIEVTNCVVLGICIGTLQRLCKWSMNPLKKVPLNCTILWAVYFICPVRSPDNFPVVDCSSEEENVKTESEHQKFLTLSCWLKVNVSSILANAFFFLLDWKGLGLHEIHTGWIRSRAVCRPHLCCPKKRGSWEIF